jgi:hypothetical protein
MVPGLRPGGGDPETMEIISWRFFMDGNEYMVGLVSSLIGAFIISAFIAAFTIVGWVLSL